MTPELTKFLQEIAGHINLAQESMTLAKTQLHLAEEKLRAVLLAKENK